MLEKQQKVERRSGKIPLRNYTRNLYNFLA